MKNLSTSIVAFLSIVPFTAAFADPGTQLGQEPTSNLPVEIVTIGDASRNAAAAASFVEGAYNVLGEAINELDQNIKDAKTSADSTYQAKTDSTVAANGNYIQAGTGVATNLGALDTQVKTNTDAIAENTTDIATLENKVVTIFTDWADRTKTAEIALNDPTPAKQ